jgi:Fe-S cluster assembly protein SufD
MSTQVANESIYRRTVTELQGRAGEYPTWVNALRESAVARFEELGFPTTDNEDWKYTNVAPYVKGGLTADAVTLGNEFSGDLSEIEPQLYEESRKSRLVFVNGVFVPALSSTEDLPEGVALLKLTDALGHERYGQLAREYLGRVADYSENGFVSLNTALISDGAFLFVPRDVCVAQPIGLIFASNSDGIGSASFPRILVVVEKGASATLIESYSGPADTAYGTNAVTEVVLEDNARLEHQRIQREGDKAFHIATTAARLGRASSWDATSINFGAGLSRHGISVQMEKEGAECRVDGLYITGEGQHNDTHSVIDHLVPNCTSHQLYKGILDGKSRAVFNGKVFVHEGARGTDAQQTNRNLLLSNEARVDTKPQLEIFNEDVKCAHGATVGQLEEEELFYLISRGLPSDTATNLLTYGFAEEVINKIKVESIKHQLDEAVLNRLHARLEI